MIRRWIRGVLLPLVLITVMACTAQAEVFTDQEKPEDWEERDLLRIWALSFLDNDAFVLECGGKTMLVDGGEKAKENALVSFLKEHGMEHLNFIFCTHPHDDHQAAVYYAIKHGKITANVFVSPFREDYIAYDNLEFQKKTVEVLEKKEIPFRQMFSGEELELGGTRITLYRFDGNTRKPGGGSITINDMSGILWVRYGDAAILLTADIGGTIQQMLAEQYGTEGLKSDILKAPHHGKNAVNGDLLRAADPKLVIITGKVARTEDCVKQLNYWGIGWKRTSYGTIVMETDGKDWYVNQEYTSEKVKKQEKQEKKKK